MRLSTITVQQRQPSTTTTGIVARTKSAIIRPVAKAALARILATAAKNLQRLQGRAERDSWRQIDVRPQRTRRVAAALRFCLK
jgi:hypothetical protein